MSPQALVESILSVNVTDPDPAMIPVFSGWNPGIMKNVILYFKSINLEPRKDLPYHREQKEFYKGQNTGQNYSVLHLQKKEGFWTWKCSFGCQPHTVGTLPVPIYFYEHNTRYISELNLECGEMSLVELVSAAGCSLLQ